MRQVIKVGGSLFDYDRLPDALGQWLEGQGADFQMLIAGGGPWADAIRHVTARFSIAEPVAHWLCVSAMQITAQILVQLFPSATLITSLDGLPANTPRGRPLLLDAFTFLRQDEPALPGIILPPTWAATSDSISARIAEVVEADELVLLKSTLPPQSVKTLDQAVACDYVDRHFPRAANRCRVRCVNLRDANFPEVVLNAGR